METVTGPTIEPVMANEPEGNKLFRMVMKHKGSDLHLKVGLPPAMRLAGVLRMMQMPPLSEADMERLMFPLLSTRQKTILEDTGGIDFAHIVFEPNGDETRFRVNLFRQRGRLSLVARRVNTNVPNFEGLGLPEVMGEIASEDQGIVILAGVTGSGKSTTIASMLQFVNQRERCHIITVEDPIEFTFKDDKSIINQREVGIDVLNWDIALKHAVRQNPDIILVGEMRDRETFSAAMHAAETGHLVFGTIHASSAPSTIGRILDLFPPTCIRRSPIARLQPQGDHRAKALADDQGPRRQERPNPHPDRRDHAHESDREEAHPQRGRQQTRRRDPNRQGGRDARLHRKPPRPLHGGKDRAVDRLRGRPQPRCASDGAQRHSSGPTRHSLIQDGVTLLQRGPQPPHDETTRLPRLSLRRPSADVTSCAGPRRHFVGPLRRGGGADAFRPILAQVDKMDRGPGFYVNMFKFVPIVILYIFWVWSNAWVDRDAREQGNENRALWNSAIFFSGIIGLALVLLVPFYIVG